MRLGLSERPQPSKSIVYTVYSFDKSFLDMPIIGTMIYNIIHSKENISAQLITEGFYNYIFSANKILICSNTFTGDSK